MADSSEQTNEVAKTDVDEKKKKGTCRPSTAARKIANAAAVVTDQHVRLNFLQQAAIMIAKNSKSGEDAFTKLARNHMRQARECLNADRVKTLPDYTRAFCKKCKQLFVSSNVHRFDLVMTQRKVMQRRCRRCGYSTNYQVGSVLSRNERARASATTGSTSEKINAPQEQG